MLVRMEHSALRWDSFRLLSWEDTVVEKHVAAGLKFEPAQLFEHDNEGSALGGDCWVGGASGVVMYFALDSWPRLKPFSENLSYKICCCLCAPCETCMNSGNVD